MDSATRLYFIIARQARKAVVFRRGPSKSVRLLSWDLATDTLTGGQWFKGRLYERRCDLSPDGELLVYFAAKHHGPLGSWTAISRPPYLKALALWPKGDGWGGGGLFDDTRTLRLNHRPGAESHLYDGFSVPKGFRVSPLGERPGWGEDDPIHSLRLMRDGWRIVSDGETSGYRRKGPFLWTYETPAVMDKALGAAKARLRVSLHGIGARRGAWYNQTAQVVGVADEVLADLGPIDWADIDPNGDILLARDGCLYRLPWPRATEPVLVADLGGMTFEPCAAPGFAAGWPKAARVPGGR